MKKLLLIQLLTSLILAQPVLAAEGINTSEGVDLPLGSSGNEYMRITKNGDVGIGTSAPTERLDINGNLNVSGHFKMNGALLSPICTIRTATSATKQPCGFSSAVTCQSDEFALSGGMTGGGNDALQNSAPLVAANGQPVGWAITVFDLNECSSNNYTANGTTVSGNPPSFPVSGGQITGAAIVTCCHF